MTQLRTTQGTATILASVGLLCAASLANEGILSQDRADLVAHTPGSGGAAAGVWFAPVDFEGEMRGVLLDDQVQPEYEIEAMMTQLIAIGFQEVPDAPAELMEGYLYGDVYRVATDQGPRELVGRLEGSWEGNQNGAGHFFALLYHLRLNPDVAGILEGDFRGAHAVDGTIIDSIVDDRSFGAPPPVHVGHFSAQRLAGSFAGVGFGQVDLPPVDDHGCSDVTACIDEHQGDARRTGGRRAIDETGAPLPATQPDGGGSGSDAGTLGGASASGASLVPQQAQPGRFHGRWKLFD